MAERGPSRSVQTARTKICGTCYWFVVALISSVPLAPSDVGALTTAEIARINSRAVVSITTEQATGSGKLGAGFVVEDFGVVVTNYHVVQGASSISVHFSSGDVFETASVLATDRARDIAILRIPAFGLSKVELGNSDSVSVGDPVVAVGSPQGLAGTVTQGIVSSLRTRTDVGYRVIQIDAAVNPGNSGGPLFDSRGRVIGVVTFKWRDSENLNFAIPINYVRGLMAAPRERGLEALASAATDTGSWTSSSSVPSRWRSLTGGKFWKVRQDGDALYVEAEFSSLQERVGARKFGRLQRAGTSWVGSLSGTHYCIIKDYIRGTQTPKDCSLTEEIAITELSSTRIAGILETYNQDDSNYDCARCRPRGVVRQMYFVWVPQ